jgi:prolyl oligopeptidase
MTVAAVANQRPDLFALVLSNVPLTDMLRYQKFPSGMSWTPEYGSTDEPGAVDYLITYSPLHTVKEKKYPQMVVVTSWQDDLVPPLHSFKLVAELQSKVDAPVYLKINSGGHEARLPRAEWYAMIANVTNTQLLGVTKSEE